MKPTKHRPKHILKDNSHYFITARTYGNLPHLAKKGAKEAFKKILHEKIAKFNDLARSERNSELQLAISAREARSKERYFNLKGWTILNNHYHLLINVEIAKFISRFINELHGASSHAIKKLPPAEITNIGQVALRKVTPMEERIDKRLDKIIKAWNRSLKAASSSDGQVASSNEEAGNEIATFRSRLTKEQFNQILSAIKHNDHLLAKTLLSLYLPSFLDIPFWYQYTDHIIRNEKDYYMHLNYSHQNCVKHGITNDMWDYKFSSINKYDKDWVLDCFRNYPIVDFKPFIPI